MAASILALSFISFPIAEEAASIPLLKNMSMAALCLNGGGTSIPLIPPLLQPSVNKKQQVHS